MGLRLVNGQTDAGASGKTTITVDAGGNVIATPFGGTATYLGASVLNQVCNGRLTLTSGTPVTTSDVTGATIVYFTPIDGQNIALYYGSAWGMYPFTEQSNSLSGATASIPYDFFAYYNGTTVSIEKLAWTSATARATALTTQNGVLVKSGDPTRRYIGTVNITAVGGAANDSVVSRGVYNYYNRRARRVYISEGTSHTYSTATWRDWNGSATSTKVDFILGWVDAPIIVTSNVYVSAASAFTVVGYYLDTTTGGPSGSGVGSSSSYELNITSSIFPTV